MSTNISIGLTPVAPPAPSTTPVPHTTRTTAQDMIDYLTDFMGADPGVEMSRVAVRAILAALRELANAANWSYYYTHGRVFTNGQMSNPQTTTATIQYQVSSGTYPYQVTLTGATWPSWAPYGTMRFVLPTGSGAGAPSGSYTTYDVDRLISPTVLTLLPAQAPQVDVPAGTAFTLYRDTYTLPPDFVSMNEGFADVAWGNMEFVHPTVWLRQQRFFQSYSNTPRYFTIMGDPKVPNRLCLRIFPYPDSDRTVDMVYKRRPRPVTLTNYSAGKASVDAVNTPSTITGTGTSWANTMVGSVIRLSGNATQLPTGLAGSNPAVLERNVQLFQSATNLTVDDIAPQTLSQVAYTISDPIDVEDGAMLEAFFRCCEKHAAIHRKFKDRQDFNLLYSQALMKAREADSRCFMDRVAGLGGPYRQRMARMPTGPDVP